MAANFCTQCGFEVAEGKRFCGRCGTVVVQRPQFNYSTPQTVSGPSHQTAGISPDVVADTTVARVENVPSIATFSPLQGTFVGGVNQPLQTPSAKPGLPFLPEQPEPMHLPPASPRITPLEPEADPASLRTQRGPSLRLLVGVAVIVVTVATVVGVYSWRHKAPASPASETSSQQQSVPVPLPAAPAPDTVVKPEPVTSPVAPEVPPVLPSAVNTPVATPERRTVVKAAPDLPPARTAPEIARIAVPPVPPPSAPIERQPPSSPRSGLLHYNGPPIHQGESVVFAGLPYAMLRFSFDHAVWQPRITHQPDGTQTLTLRSLTQQEQATCEVRWEVAQ